MDVVVIVVVVVVVAMAVGGPNHCSYFPGHPSTAMEAALTLVLPSVLTAYVHEIETGWGRGLYTREQKYQCSFKERGRRERREEAALATNWDVRSQR